MHIHFISAKGLKGKGLFQKVIGVFTLLKGVIESFRLLFRLKPKIVFGVGGYASAPTVFAAALTRWIGGWKVAVLDQNSSAGLANRLFAKLPLGIEAFAGFEQPYFKVVDLPIRLKIERASREARPISWAPKSVLILGGSQGAKGLSDRWLDLVSELSKKYPGLKIYHQTGKTDFERVQNRYKELNIEAEVFPFSDTMEKYYALSDLIVCRSGAMSVFEAMAFKRPTLFVPFPFATDDHQRKNALAVQKPEWVLKESELTLEKVLAAFASSPETLIPERRMSNRSDWNQIFASLNQ